MKNKLAEYRKFIVAILGVTIPFLKQLGVDVPSFLTASYVDTVLLSVTPLLVALIPNKSAAQKPS